MIINNLTFHCSASRPAQARTQTAADIDRMHRERGFAKIGYHYFVRYDGTIEKGRPDIQVGAHVAGHNTGNLGVCYAGGLDDNGNPKDTRTPQQKASLRLIAGQLIAKHPNLKKEGALKGHRDWSPDLDKDGKIEKHEWLKDCPCFDVATEL